LAGIYLHIPFCRSACHYCNFHFTTSLKGKEKLLPALCKEIELRKNYLPDRHLKSIYFGGGTPSLLNIREIDLLLNQIFRYFTMEQDAEMTIEANPDDLTQDYLKGLIELGINRLSIGIQSFFEDDLRWLGRTHSAEQAEKALESALATGFSNLSIDLIYGIPASSHFTKNLQKLKDFDIPHFSAYSLTLEPKTIYSWQVKKNRKLPPADDDMIRDFNLLCDFAEDNHYQHYEISNFSREGFRAIHNSAYWKNEPYLGIGPSAHSYNLISRQWNINVNHKYIMAISEGKDYFESETLSKTDRLNEYIMTRLRTSDGIDYQYLISLLTEEQKKEFDCQTTHFIRENFMSDKNGFLILTRKGMLLSDYLINKLFVE